MRATGEAEQAVPWIRIDRSELGGAFGDLGTSVPLLTGLIVSAGFNAGAVLVGFGLLQVFSALRYGMPMSVQPLKAVAALAVAGHLRPSVVWAAGLVIGLTMLCLQLLGLVAWLGKRIPPVVIRGLQLGLGLKLAVLALGSFIPADGVLGLGLATASALLLLALRRQRRVPPALVLLGLGVAYAIARRPELFAGAGALHFSWPSMAHIEPSDVWPALVLLALPQLPLSLANSIYATEKTARDLFPHRRVTAGTVAFTYAAMNLLAPLVGGVPVCHGAGGIAGHHAFGARTGGSVLVCGLGFVAAGLFAADRFGDLVHVLPLPTLGVLLGFEALAMARLAVAAPRSPLSVGVLAGIAMVAAFAPYGFAIALGAGTLAIPILERRKCRA